MKTMKAWPISRNANDWGCLLLWCKKGLMRSSSPVGTREEVECFSIIKIPCITFNKSCIVLHFVNMGTCKDAHFEVFSKFSHFSFHSWSMSANLILQLVYYSFQRQGLMSYQLECLPATADIDESIRPSVFLFFPVWSTLFVNCTLFSS